LNRTQSVPAIDLERLAGKWYVIAHIPARMERLACGAVVVLAFRDDASLQISYRFTLGTPDGPRKLVRARGHALDRTSLAEWRLQPFWPFAWPVKWPCEIKYVDPDYQSAVVAHPKWKHVWILTRTPIVPEQAYLDLVGLAQSLGCDPSRLRRVPQMLGAPLPPAAGQPG
jgi:apolipoprotein D and lipocalin family protein